MLPFSWPNVGQFLAFKANGIDEGDPRVKHSLSIRQF